MFSNILSTFFSRVFTMLIMLIVVVINANSFGAEGVGTIGLMILNITILQLITSFIGGTTLVYLIPRRLFKNLILLSVLWAIIGNVGGVFLLKSLSMVPKNYIWLLLFISVIFSFNSIQLTLFQAIEKIKTYNFFQIFQSILLIFSLLFLLLREKILHLSPHIDSYFYSYFISYFLTFIVSGVLVLRWYQKGAFKFAYSDLTEKNQSLWRQFKEMLTLGFWVQVANLAQLLNYRLSYYLIEWYIGRKPLGIYDMGTKLSEAVWVFPKSLCLVQYARLSNNSDFNYARKLTLMFTKISALFTLLVLIVLLLLPASFYAWIFGTDFLDIKAIIYALSPGIFFLSCLSIISHHFAAKGDYWKNALSSLIGLILTAIGGYLFIPLAAKSGYLNGIFIAGLVTSASYFVSLLVSLVFFNKETPLKFSDFIISNSEMDLFKTEVLKLIKQVLPKK
jgi:O-antigen/teichoic acid export membrane protein